MKHLHARQQASLYLPKQAIDLLTTRAMRITWHRSISSSVIGDSFQEADQVGISAEINGRGSGFGHREGACPASKPGSDRAVNGALEPWFALAGFA
jgi:hypothetical protein